MVTILAVSFLVQHSVTFRYEWSYNVRLVIFILRRCVRIVEISRWHAYENTSNYTNTFILLQPDSLDVKPWEAIYLVNASICKVFMRRLNDKVSYHGESSLQSLEMKPISHINNLQAFIKLKIIKHESCSLNTFLLYYSFYGLKGHHGRRF